MLVAQHITKKYGSRLILNDISLSINEGEMLAILGKSGAGKSTLLHILGTLDQPDEGKMIMDGVDISSLKNKELATFRNQSLGFIFQFHYLLPEFTAIENICIPAWINQKMTTQKVEQRAKELLTWLGLEKRGEAKPNQLSGGEQQRIAIARALINSPQYILADEPTGNLDTESSKLFMELMLKLKQKNNFTLIMVTHNENIVKDFDKMIWMSDGKISNKRI